MNMQLEMQTLNPADEKPDRDSKSSQSVDDNRPPSTHRGDSNRVRITTDVDNAFRELARLKSLKSDNHDDEHSIDEKINEIKALLEAMGYPASTEILKKKGYIRPRPSQS